MNAIDLSLVEACSSGAHLPIAEAKLVSDWLDAFEADNSRQIVLDRTTRLWADYDELGGDQNRVALILLDKLQKGHVLHVGVPAPAGDTPPVGPQWVHLDTHRTVLLAVVLNANAHVSLANATHPDWHPTRLPPEEPHPTIDNVLADWLDELVRRLTPLPCEGRYQAPPPRLSGSLASAVPVGVGKNRRKAWETPTHRYEWDYQHGTVEEYNMSGVWRREATPDGRTTKTAHSGPNRTWGR